MVCNPYCFTAEIFSLNAILYNNEYRDRNLSKINWPPKFFQRSKVLYWKWWFLKLPSLSNTLCFGVKQIFFRVLRKAKAQALHSNCPSQKPIQLAEYGLYSAITIFTDQSKVAVNARTPFVWFFIFYLCVLNQIRLFILAYCSIIVLASFIAHYQSWHSS
jgi:hypothetical protein